MSAADLYSIQLPAGRALDNLSSLSQQTSLAITLSDVPPEATTRAVSGEFTAAAALGQMLTDSSLTFAFVGPHRVEVHPARGAVRWYDIPAGPALASLHTFIDTLRQEASVDRHAALRVQTPAVRGCLTAEHAAHALFDGTPLTYHWISGPPDFPGPIARALIVRGEPPLGLRRLIQQEQIVMIVPLPNPKGWQCWALCTAEGEPAPRPTCVQYPLPQG